MKAEELTKRLVASRARAPEGEQLRLLLALCDRYEAMGVLGGTALQPLHTICPCADECWKGIAARPSGRGQFDPLSEKGCMFLPWVGPLYRPGGICILGMNLRYGGADWELAMEHRIALDPEGGQENSLRTRHRAHRSRWSKSTMLDAAAVLRSSRGEEDLEARDPNELADTLLATARVQPVKCSPIGGRSSPTPAMVRNCPPRYVGAELEILAPSVVIAYGRPAHGALRQLGRFTPDGNGVPGFMRGVIELGGRATTALLMRHPGHGGWSRAHRALKESLLARRIER